MPQGRPLIVTSKSIFSRNLRMKLMMKLIKANHITDQPWRVVLMVALAMMHVEAVAVDQPLSKYSSTAESEARQALPGCNYFCGSTKIPYPFGIGTSSHNNKPCYLELEPQIHFELKCTNSVLYMGNAPLPVSHIDIPQGQMDVSFPVYKVCNTSSAYYGFSTLDIDTAWLTISNTENKFVTVGRNSAGQLTFNVAGITNNSAYFLGCEIDNYDNPAADDDGRCSGRGCCQVDIPPHMWNISIVAVSIPNQYSNSSCSYSFAVKKDNYTFSSTHLQRRGLPFNETPVVLDWTIGNNNCSASKSICSNNSYCDDKDTDFGYRCRCKDGYEGNPYHPDGCTDINECTTSNHTCIGKEHCKNTLGSYTCSCPVGQIGNGRRDGGCRSLVIPTVLGVGAALIVLFVGTFSYSVYVKRKFIKLKEKFFQQNGGFILRQKLHQRNDSSQTAHIFKENELKKATNNYDESSIIGRGGFGTVFKGVLADDRIVAIKKSKSIDADQIEQFINEVDIVSQINHRNVVKLLGCCLETQVPLLVYEFVSNGTLFDFIHTDRNESNATWKTRLRIATEVAGALSYLHSAASIPIIHRDVKSDNILLDENHTAKVSDFGASRLIPLDQTEVATMVQGTIGYLDPEYMQTSQLTEKSDVYSFGVVLVELLTGEKPFSFCRPEEKRMLSMHFLSCLGKGCLFEIILDGILNEENKQEIKEVAILASKCLKLKGEERPSMKEVAMEMEGLRLMEKHSWIHSDSNLEETQCLLHEASSSIYEFGGSSKHGDTRYDSLKDQVQLVALDDGR